MEKVYDVIILGRGPAGLSTALYTQRAKKETLILGKIDGALSLSNIENFFGIEKATNGKTLIDNTEKNLKKLGATILDEICTKFDYEENGFKVKTESGKSFLGKNIVLAIGKNNKDKYSEFLGKGVSYCATCDGFFYKNKTVAVLGNTKASLQDAKYLKNICKKVYIFTDNKNLEFENEDFSIIEGKLEKINLTNDRIQSVDIDNKNILIDGLFVSKKFTPNTAINLGLETENGFIKVNSYYETSIKNIFAVGDCVGLPFQVAKAVYDGMICGMFLSKNK